MVTPNVPFLDPGVLDRSNSLTVMFEGLKNIHRLGIGDVVCDLDPADKLTVLTEI